MIFLTAARLHRVDDVTNLVETDAKVDASSPTGYSGRMRNLIVPAHNNDSYQWIVQTQQMLAPGGDWRIRKVSYDNAPTGRAVLTSSAYRWWLGLVAEVDHLLSGRPIGVSVERAARLAGPALHVLLLLGLTGFAAWRFGWWPAGLVSVAVATLFPFGGAFLPGQPTDGSLVLICLSASVLLLLSGLRPRSPAAQSRGNSAPTLDRHASPWFLAAGIAGGIGLWVNALRSFPMIAGIAAAGLLAAWTARQAIKSGGTPLLLPWRLWALGGSATVLGLYLLEYFPDHLGELELTVVHPLYALVWLGVGEALVRLGRAVQPPGSRRDWYIFIVVCVAIAAAIGSAVWVDMKGTRDLFTVDPNATRLTNLVGSPIARNFWAWLRNDGITLTVVATCLPLVLAIAAGRLLLRRTLEWRSRAVLAVGLGPALVLLLCSVFQLRGWNDFDATLPGLLVALTLAAGGAFKSSLARRAGAAGILLVLTPGLLLLTREAIADLRVPATEAEITALIERDLAQWLARQSGGEDVIVLAPPSLTTSLIYHGGLSGLGTPFWENKAGFLASLRIAGATSADEAQAVAQARQLDYIVMPSWDPFLDEYALPEGSEEPRTLWGFLKTWRPPRWLQPVPYHLPQIPGFETQSVVVFRVIEVQDNATALSYLAEYFVEMGMMREAVAVAYALERSYPADLGAAVARTLVARAERNPEAFGRAIDAVQAALARDEGEDLAWDRRVSLAIALLDADRVEQSRAEVKRCLAEIDASRVRSLSTVALHRLLVLSRTFDLTIEDPQIYALAQQLLPAEMRDRP